MPRSSLHRRFCVFVALPLAILSAAAEGQVVGGSIITGAGDVDTHVKRIDAPTLQDNASLFAYPGFTGGVRVAAGDVNGDGVADFITGPGAGAGPNVKLFHGTTLATIDSFNAFGAGFTWGAVVIRF